MQSEHWRLLRGAKLQLSPRCERCKGKEELEVHHVVYRANLFDGELSDLKTLCHGCHMEEHAKEWAPHGIPQEFSERRRKGKEVTRAAIKAARLAMFAARQPKDRKPVQGIIRPVVKIEPAPWELPHDPMIPRKFSFSPSPYEIR